MESTPDEYTQLGLSSIPLCEQAHTNTSAMHTQTQTVPSNTSALAPEHSSRDLPLNSQTQIPVYPLSQTLPKVLVHLPTQKSGQGASMKLFHQISLPTQVGKHCQFPGVSQGLLLA